jgi:hypothetical protein
MAGSKEVFIRDLMSVSPDCKSGEEGQLRETLALQWEEFVDEYAQVSAESLDERFSRFILIESPRGDTLH